ncbi:restriction endonuclease subunit S [Salinivibrio costicola]|uniref:Restriction endonuclease subunit S n=1 Tax=Salinivibrio costicola TaxID=51367 RepID=A0ABX6K8Y4_SALCS|nr:restriction endonuclease subunit S [Salinivibrio costicola]QIR06833.1 restriction endonuclease subunit S [Salinivibrio costicola]
MSGKYQAYPEYKDSGVEWVGNLPVAWDLSKLKHMFSIINGSTPKSGISTYWDGNITWVTPADLSKLPNFQIGASVRTITEDGLNSCGTTIVPSGSLVLSSRAPIGSLAVTSVPLCTNQGCKSLVVRESVCVKYVYYYLSVMKEQLNLFGRGTTFLELSTDDLGNFPIPLLAQAESENIAKFLDHETAKIDTLIEKQQQLIKLLKEKRQAVISHAVTKGLNPQASMKDSGVEWLGEVPEHWVVAQLKFNTKLMQTGPFGSQLHAEDYVEGGVPLINPAHMINGEIVPDPQVSVDADTQDRLSRHKLAEGDIIFARRGELGRCAVVTDQQVGWLCGTGSLKASLNERLTPEYAYLLITSDGVVAELSLESKGSTMDNLNTETLGKIRTPVPPVHEQRAILAYVDEVSGKYKQLVDMAENAIELMKERRTALISSAVTGKIDVRNWQAPTSQQQALEQTA